MAIKTVRSPRLLVWVSLSMLTPLLLAQTTGRIEGRAQDDSGRPLAGVTVTALSLSLQGERIKTTDNGGRFWFLSLPTGDYTATAELEGFNRVEAEDLRVTLDRTLSLQLQLTPIFGEEMTVSAEAPALDVTSTASGAAFSEEVFRDLPTSRTFEGLTFAAPAAVYGGLGENPSIRGTSAAENRYLVDGIDITDPSSGTLSSSRVFEMLDEMEVNTGGYEAEYGGALGGVINVITKSGGNQLRGNFFAYYSNDRLQATLPATLAFGRQAGFTEYDFGFDLGGKFIEDRLWYVAAVNPRYFKEDFTTRQEIPIAADSERVSYAGKLIDSRQRLVSSVFGDRREVQYAVRYPGDLFDSLNAAGRILHDFETDAASYSLDYSAVLGSNELLEVTAGRFEVVSTRTPVDNRSPWYNDLTGIGCWAQQENCGEPSLLEGGNVSFAVGCEGGAFVNRLDGTRDQLKAGASALMGSHELKAGVDYRHTKYAEIYRNAGKTVSPLVDSAGTIVDSEGTPGGNFLLFPPDEGWHLLIQYDQAALGETDELAVFLQDRWQVGPGLILNLGVRIDSIHAVGEIDGLDFDFDQMIAPRIGFVWDWAGKGRSKLYSHFGRFYESLPIDFNARQLGGGGYLCVACWEREMTWRRIRNAEGMAHPFSIEP